MSHTIPRTGVAQKVMLARQAAKQRDQEDATATRHTFVAPKVAAAAAAAPQEPAPPREHIPRGEASSSRGEASSSRGEASSSRGVLPSRPTLAYEGHLAELLRDAVADLHAANRAQRVRG
jgi:hypothetical protein